MLDANQLAEYCAKRYFTTAARQVIDQVRSSPPSRRVKSGIANVACRFASRKMGGVIQAESHKNELPTVVELEHDPATHEYYDQPPKIKLSYRNAKGRSIISLVTVDFFVLQDDFTGWIECKTEDWLKARAAEDSTLYVPDGNGGWRCPPGEHYAEALGLGFRVRSSAETNWVMHRNLEYLADFLDERCPVPKDDDVKRILEVFGDQSWLKLKELVEADHGVTADVIHKMIADGLLYVELDKDLLAEPERTIVFRDRLSAEAYASHLASLQVPALAEIQSITLEPGQSLIWDGKPWRIQNVGDGEIFLEGPERVFTTLSRHMLEHLVRKGSIQGLAPGVGLNWDKAELILRRASPDDFKEALKRFHCIFPDKTEKKPAPVSARALRKWRALYEKSADLFGAGFFGLLPKLHLRGNRNRKLDEKVIEEMNKAIDELFAKPQQKSVAGCWGDVCITCEKLGFTAPSERAFRAEIRRRRRHDLKVAREGEKAAYDDEEFYWQFERTTPRHGERPFEIGHIDHTEIDLNFVGSRRGERLSRAWLSLMIDANTRNVLAWAVLFESPSYRSCMAVIRDCVKRHGRVPKYIVVDKGAEFEGIYFECLLARLEVHKKTRPGGKPRFGSVIERVFGISNKAFIHNLVGNNQALQRPRRMSKTHDPRRLAVWTLPEFHAAFEGFLDKVYSAMEHPALGMSPKQAMAVGLAQSGPRSHTLIPYTQDFVIMCLPTTTKGAAKVEPARGVKIGYIYYWTPEFHDPAYTGRSVCIRYDPFDVSTAFAWLGDHWAICRSEYTAEFQDRSEKEIMLATQEIRARYKRTGERHAINARLIAHYLRETSATEVVLTQRKRQQEMVEAFPLQVVPGRGHRPADGIPPPASDNLWQNLSLKIVGDFQ